MNAKLEQRTGYIFLLLTALILSSIFISFPTLADTQFYFIRHAEFEKKDPAKPLNKQGRIRAMTLIDYFKNVKLTHLYATHTDRTRDTVMPLAEQQKLTVKQFPPIGSEVEWSKVSNMSKGKIAIKPMTAALKLIPDGSNVVVAGNSSNIFAIAAGLGVQVSSKEKPCAATDESCLPCIDKSCFPKEFHNIWKVTITDKGVTIIKSHYGDVPPKTTK